MREKATIVVVTAIGGFLALLAAGCKEDEGPDCSQVDNPCEEPGVLRCSTDGTAVEECIGDEAGCLAWTLSDECAASEECDDTGDLPFCTCVDACAPPDETRCAETVVQTCQEAASGCLDWTDTQDCADSGLACSEAGGNAQCTAICTDECAAAGDLRCQGDLIQACAEGAEGCFVWSDETDCSTASETCSDAGGAPECITSCTDECTTEGSSRCSAMVIETCEAAADGCLYWMPGEDCSTTSLVCNDTAEPAVCRAGSGESCTDAEWIEDTPFVRQGADFMVDYADDHRFTDASCTELTGTSEAVFVMDLAAGQEIVVRELGGLDVVVSIQGDCGRAEACMLSEDFGETAGFRYTAPADERIFIIVEAFAADPIERDYEIHVDRAETEICDDGFDNDIDSLSDCDDQDCFGAAGTCETELNCSDGEDNDADTLADCDDTDCGTSAWCAPYKGYWEQFETGDLVDVTGHAIIFDPAPADVNGYTRTEAGGVAAFPEIPGGGTSTTRLSLGDEDSAAYSFSVMGSFTFFGASYSTMYVCSNGSITFGAGDDFSDSLTSSFFGYPRIAGFDADLDPHLGADGTITVDEYGDRVAVTFQNVPRWNSSETASFQIILSGESHSDPGRIVIAYLDIQITDGGMIGISSGTGNGTFPDETDFVPPLPPVINEIAYEGPGTDGGEFVEIYALGAPDLSRYTLVHINGEGGAMIWAVSLSATAMPTDGFLVIGSALVENVDMTWESAGIPETNAMRNDGETLVLYSDYGLPTQSVVDAVAWETAANLFGEGNPSSGIELGPWNNSIGRYRDGRDTGDNLTDLVQSWWATPGAPNTPAQPASFARVAGSASGVDIYPVAIPDGTPSGVTLTIDNPAFFPATIGDIHVGLRLTHPYRGDLIVDFRSPAGTTVRLHDRGGLAEDDLKTVYDFVTAPATGTMSDLDGQSTTGVWTLIVSDSTAGDIGRVDDWIIWARP